MERNALPREKGTAPPVLSSARKRISSGDRGSQRQGVAHEGMRRHIGENYRGVARVGQQQQRQDRGQRKRGGRARAHAATARAVIALAAAVMRRQHAAGRVMVAVLMQTRRFAGGDCSRCVVMRSRPR